LFEIDYDVEYLPTFFPKRVDFFDRNGDYNLFETPAWRFRGNLEAEDEGTKEVDERNSRSLFFFSFFSTGTYVYFALSRNTSYS